MKQKSKCDDCMNYILDDETGYYICLVDFDQDEMEDFLTYHDNNCPYYRFLDDYALAKKQ